MGNCCRRDTENAGQTDGETITQKADSMQEVLSNVYMGSAVAAQNKELLKSNGITHILAIGWNLEIHFENDFKYLLINKVEDSPECVILSHFEKCFYFMDDCLINTKNGKIYVHCHKGLSRSATIVIAYEMYKKKLSFDNVLAQIRKNRSFIMPNIGFQAQMKEFEHQNFSLNMDVYTDFDVINFIQNRLPKMLQRIKFNYNAYKNSNDNIVDENELFELTLYTHQVHKLNQNNIDKLTENDINILNESIKVLRSIQVEFVNDEASIKRFDIMFRRARRKNNNANNEKKVTEQVAVSNDADHEEKTDLSDHVANDQKEPSSDENNGIDEQQQLITA